MSCCCENTMLARVNGSAACETYEVLLLLCPLSLSTLSYLWHHTARHRAAVWESWGKDLNP